jgi:hypothetical protein
MRRTARSRGGKGREASDRPKNPLTSPGAAAVVLLSDTEVAERGRERGEERKGGSPAVTWSSRMEGEGGAARRSLFRLRHGISRSARPTRASGAGRGARAGGRGQGRASQRLARERGMREKRKSEEEAKRLEAGKASEWESRRPTERTLV